MIDFSIFKPTPFTGIFLPGTVSALVKSCSYCIAQHWLYLLCLILYLKAENPRHSCRHATHECTVHELCCVWVGSSFWCLIIAWLHLADVQGHVSVCAVTVASGQRLADWLLVVLFALGRQWYFLSAVDTGSECHWLLDWVLPLLMVEKSC